MKKKLNTAKLLILACSVLCFASLAFSQNARPEEARQIESFQPGAPNVQRPNLLEELGLTPDQIQAVRRINQERKPQEQAARRRFQDAQRELNIAIYRDNSTDADVQSKLSEFQAAQAELARIKFTNELAIRKVLTPSQLVRFRELRRRFAEARQEMRDGPAKLPRRPLQRLRRQNMPLN